MISYKMETKMYTYSIVLSTFFQCIAPSIKPDVNVGKLGWGGSKPSEVVDEMRSVIASLVTVDKEFICDLISVCWTNSIY